MRFDVLSQSGAQQRGGDKTAAGHVRGPENPVSHDAGVPTWWTCCICGSMSQTTGLGPLHGCAALRWAELDAIVTAHPAMPCSGCGRAAAVPKTLHTTARRQPAVSAASGCACSTEALCAGLQSG